MKSRQVNHPVQPENADVSKSMKLYNIYETVILEEIEKSQPY
jgi:hypothetical protein